MKTENGITNRRDFWIKISLFFFALFLLRVYGLSRHEFWYDEIYSVDFARSPLLSWNAPLYWIIIHFWSKLFGLSEFSLRFPSAIFSLATCVGTYVLGKMIFSRRIGLLSALIIGLSPFHLWYAQEARNYSLVTFLGIFSSYLFFRALNERKTIFWVYFVVISLLGVYTNYFYLFLLFFQGVYFVCFRGVRFKLKEIWPFLIVLAGFMFYFPGFISKFAFVKLGFWVPKPELGALLISFENFLLGYSGNRFFYLVASLITLVCIGALLYKVIKDKAICQGVFFCFCLSFAPILLIFLFSSIFFSIYLDRGLMLFSPYFYILLSLGLFYLVRRWRIIVFISLVFLQIVAIFGFYQDRMYPPLKHHIGTYLKKPVKPAITFLEDNVREGDIVAYTNPSAIRSMEYYSQRRLADFYMFFDPSLSESSWQRPIQETATIVPYNKIRGLPAERIWVIFNDWGRTGGLDEHSKIVKDWMDENLTLKTSREFDGLWVLEYTKKVISP
ncbi:MAG: glycosyltransferase family 39 protein [Candidatus Omnitrophica bacterium]|nr:glycosyltransferase family 39 protein [Candidatus Omnitrophota bacterium]